MRRKSNVAFGPGAASLILIVVILSMSVLGMLALMNARNDARLSGWRAAKRYPRPTRNTSPPCAATSPRACCWTGAP